MDLADEIQTIPDFPKPGILFYDIAPLLRDPSVFAQTISQLKERLETYKPDIIMGIESRGFLFGPPLAQALGIPFGMIRKKGKLPGAVISHEYDLEYGSDCIEIQENTVEPDMRVVIFDDLLATGGTASAAISLIKKIEAMPVAAAFIIELKNLKGREKIPLPLETLMAFDG